jgi:hypothetical protein
MDRKRRQFLKIAGLSTIAGLGAPAAFNMLLKGKVSPVSFASSGAGTEASHGAAQAGVRLGMIIDQRVFDANKDLAQKCITACHTVHNVPDFDNPKDEIKWIFQVPYEKTTGTNTCTSPVSWCSATIATTPPVSGPARRRRHSKEKKTASLPWIITAA